MGCPTPLDCKGLKVGELIYNILDHITAMVFQAFWAEEHGFLENKETDRNRGGYSQCAGPQQGSPTTQNEITLHPQERKSSAVIQVSSNRLCLKGTGAHPQPSGGNLKASIARQERRGEGSRSHDGG